MNPRERVLKTFGKLPGRADRGPVQFEMYRHGLRCGCYWCIRFGRSPDPAQCKPGEGAEIHRTLLQAR